MRTLTERIYKGLSEDLTCEPDSSDKKEQVTEIIASARSLRRVWARPVEETERQGWSMNKIHSLANLSTECCKDE